LFGLLFFFFFFFFFFFWGYCERPAQKNKWGSVSNKEKKKRKRKKKKEKEKRKETEEKKRKKKKQKENGNARTDGVCGRSVSRDEVDGVLGNNKELGAHETGRLCAHFGAQARQERKGGPAAVVVRVH
jgi:hypothetical protein